MFEVTGRLADGWAARNVHQLNLRESEEMRIDREYLEKTCESLESSGLVAECLLAGGDPSKEITAAAARGVRWLIDATADGSELSAK